MVNSHKVTKSLTLWLFGTCFLIWLMIMLGGATRLTHSGLSIVEWKPITGIIPPLSETAWLEEFAKYQRFPEYQLINQGMTLAEFKFIFFMEYTHRLLGRLIGLFFFIPLAYFWFHGHLTSQLKKMAISVTFLGLAQGFMGWYMVKSGLVHKPSVSHYRLTAHLILALILFGILFLAGLRHLYPRQRILPPVGKKSIMLTHFSALFILLTIIYGGLVAGLKAGKMYNTYPLMGGNFIPFEWNYLSPVWLNFFENAATVQWIHRTLAIVTMILVIFAMIGLRCSSYYGQVVKKAAKLMLTAICFQVLLGIMTLLHEVPVSLGTLHQGTAVVVLGLILLVIHNIHHRAYD